MLSSAISHWNVLTLAGLLCLFVGGCTSKPPVASDSTEARFRLLGRYYGEYLSAHGGQGPKDEQAFLQYLKEFTQYLQTQGIAQPSDLLVSPRDQQPLHVLYGRDVIEDGPGGFPWIAYEQQGVDGKHYLIGARGASIEFSPEEFAEFLSEHAPQ